MAHDTALVFRTAKETAKFGGLVNTDGLFHIDAYPADTHDGSQFLVATLNLILTMRPDSGALEGPLAADSGCTRPEQVGYLEQVRRSD